MLLKYQVQVCELTHLLATTQLPWGDKPRAIAHITHKKVTKGTLTFFLNDGDN
jgi:hypothetical protein